MCAKYRTLPQICHFTAFSLVPMKSASCKVCLISLKNTSISQRALYNSQIEGASYRYCYTDNSCYSKLCRGTFHQAYDSYLEQIQR